MPFKIFAQGVAALVLGQWTLSVLPISYVFFCSFEPHHGCHAGGGEGMMALYIFAGAFLMPGCLRQLRQILPRHGMRAFWLGAAAYYAFPLVLALTINSWEGLLQTYTKSFPIRFKGDLSGGFLQLCMMGWPIVTAASLLMALFSLLKELTEAYSPPETIRQPWVFWIFIGAGLVVTAGSAFHDIARSERIYYESQRAGTLVKILQFSDPSALPGHISNTVQVLSMRYAQEPTTLASLSNDYRVRVGSRREERFVFFPPRTRIPPVEGELLFVSTRPYPDFDGRPRRTIVSQEGTGYASYRMRTESEKRFQEMCKSAGISVPLPVSEPCQPWLLKAAVGILSLCLLGAFCPFVWKRFVAMREKVL